MLNRRQTYIADRNAGNPSFYFLSADSSMQRGHDYMMTLEDSIRMNDATTLLELGKDFDWNTFNAAGLLCTTALPTGLVGAGNSALPGKFEAFVESLKLDIGLPNMRDYGRRVISFVADYGTEAKFLDAFWPDWQHVQPKRRLTTTPTTTTHARSQI